MLGLGGGEILGALVFGRIADKLENKQTIMINMLTATVGYIFLILYASIYDFTYYMAIFMTFTTFDHHFWRFVVVNKPGMFIFRDSWW